MLRSTRVPRLALGRVLGVLLPLLAATSCGGGGPYTWGDACDTAVTGYCNRLNACGLLNVSIGTCMEIYMLDCCQGAACDETAPSKEQENAVKAEAADCVSDLRELGCDYIADYYLPDTCLIFAGGAAAAAPVARQSLLPQKSK